MPSSRQRPIHPSPCRTCHYAHSYVLMRPLRPAGPTQTPGRKPMFMAALHCLIEYHAPNHAYSKVALFVAPAWYVTLLGPSPMLHSMYCFPYHTSTACAAIAPVQCFIHGKGSSRVVFSRGHIPLVLRIFGPFPGNTWKVLIYEPNHRAVSLDIILLKARESSSH